MTKNHEVFVKQILRFGVVGGGAFAIDAGILFFLTEYFGIDPLISNIISFTVSVIFNYILSITWVFDGKRIGKRGKIYSSFSSSASLGWESIRC